MEWNQQCNSGLIIFWTSILVRNNIKKSSGFLRCYVWLLLTKSVMQNQRYFENERESVCSIYLDAVWSWKTRKSVAMMERTKRGASLKKTENNLRGFPISWKRWCIIPTASSVVSFPPPIKKFYARFFALNKWWGKASNIRTHLLNSSIVY